MAYAGILNAATNPNYPSAAVNAYYLISTAGKVGGREGRQVNAGDIITCTQTSSGGTQAAEGGKWTVTPATTATKLAADLSLATAPSMAVEAVTTSAATITTGNITDLNVGATRVGVATIAAEETTVDVTTTAAATASAIIVTPRVSCDTTPCYVSAISAGESFTITGDPGVYSWLIVDPI